jgi:hypothetical protein
MWMLRQFHSFYFYFTLQNFLFGVCFVNFFIIFFSSLFLFCQRSPWFSIIISSISWSTKNFQPTKRIFCMDKQTDRHTDRKTNRQADRQTDSRLSFQHRSFLPYLLPSDSLTPLASGLSAYGLTPFLSICILTFLSVRLSFFLVNLWQKWLRNNEVIFQQK